VELEKKTLHILGLEYVTSLVENDGLQAIQQVANCSCNYNYTRGPQKGAVTVKNQQILMQFSLIDLKMNGTCDSTNFTHLA